MSKRVDDWVSVRRFIPGVEFTGVLLMVRKRMPRKKQWVEFTTLWTGVYDHPDFDEWKELPEGICAVCLGTGQRTSC